MEFEICQPTVRRLQVGDVFLLDGKFRFVAYERNGNVAVYDDEGTFMGGHLDIHGLNHMYSDFDIQIVEKITLHLRGN